MNGPGAAFVVGPGDPVFETVGIELVVAEELEDRYQAGELDDADVERLRELIGWGRGWADRLAGGGS